MGTTADKLNYLLATKDEIKAAITAKGVDVSSSTFRECAQKIREIPQEVNVLEPTITEGNANVRFIDYDGTLIHSYTKDEFLALTEMPALPSRPRLVCQGWNYDMEDAKAYVEEYGKLDVGATYITDDGKTRLYITIAAEGRMTVPLYFSQTIANGVTIDWGDGSATQTLSGTGYVNPTHTYADIGEYTISLNPSSGCTLGLGRTSSSNCVMGSIGDNGKVYCNMLQAVEIGQNVTSIGDNAFYSCYSLASVVIPDSVTSIGDNAFYSCYSLASVVIPDSVTSIGGYAFCDCHSLAGIVIPEGVTNIGGYAFRYCYSLASVVIPQSVTSIGDNVFCDCRSLASIVIPDSVTNIGGYAFAYCYSLASVVIPKGVTSIGGYAFRNCYGMAYYDFTQCTSVPALGVTSVFNGIPSDCKIVVPDDLYDTWIAAENWSTYASYIIKAPLKGVFIQHVNGSLHTEESWTSGGFGNDKANGVAVVTDNARFVIAKSDLGKMPWSSNTSTAVDGIMLTSDEATAKTDFAGYNNTQLMLATDTSGAGYSCANFTFPNGDKGYLPALGELNEAYANKSKIDSLMTKIGGVKLQSSYYWSSTQYNSYTSWILGWNNGNADYYSKYATTYYVRAFSALSL